MRPRWLAALVAILALAGWTTERAAEPETSSRRGTWDCGTIALYHWLHLEGRSIGLDRLESLLGPPGPRGHSMRELRDAARRCGLAADAVVLAKKRSSLDGAVLSFLKMGREGHFVVVRPVGHTGQLVQVLDGDRDPVVIDAERLFTSPSWTGLALVPRRSNWPALVALGLAIACLFALAARWRRHARTPSCARPEPTASGQSSRNRVL